MRTSHAQDRLYRRRQHRLRQEPARRYSRLPRTGRLDDCAARHRRRPAEHHQESWPNGWPRAAARTPESRPTWTAAPRSTAPTTPSPCSRSAATSPSTVIDFEIPKKYGLRQTIGDTLGIGGIMRGLRTIPVFLDMARDMEQLCPDAWLLNYVNPMAINTWAIQKATKIKNVGLCHSVQGTVEHLAEDIDVPVDEIRYICAGINHMAFYLNFWRRTPDGGVEDLYPRIHQVVEEGRVPGAQPGALRDAPAAGLLRHRVERALRRVRAVVHQARPARPDREVQHPAGRVPAPLRVSDRRLGVRPQADGAARSRSPMPTPGLRRLSCGASRSLRRR